MWSSPNTWVSQTPDAFKKGLQTRIGRNAERMEWKIIRQRSGEAPPLCNEISQPHSSWHPVISPLLHASVRQFSVPVMRTWDHHFVQGICLFGSPFWRLQSVVNCPHAFSPVEGSGEHVGTEYHHTMTRKWRRERYKTWALLSLWRHASNALSLQCPAFQTSHHPEDQALAYKSLGDAKDALNRSTL